MKLNELVVAGIGYLVSVTIAYFIFVRFQEDAVGLAHVTGTIIGVLIAAWLYQSRNEEIAPAKIKLIVGVTLSGLCVLQGLIFQYLLKWMTYPDISIFFGSLGAIAFSFGIWNSFAKSVISSRKK